MRRFDACRQQESQTIAEYEHSLRTLYRKAWPSADAQHKDSALKGKFEEGLSNPEMAQFLRLHARQDDFAQTVARARQFQEAYELAKPAKKPSIRLAQAPDHSATSEDKQANQLQPVLDGLQQVLQTVLQGQSEKVDTSARRHKTPRVRAASRSDCRGGTSTERRQPSPAPSGTSAPSNSSNREKAVRFHDQPSARCQQSTRTRQPASSGQDRERPPAQRSWNNSNTQGNPPRSWQPRNSQLNNQGPPPGRT